MCTCINRLRKRVKEKSVSHWIMSTISPAFIFWFVSVQDFSKDPGCGVELIYVLTVISSLCHYELGLKFTGMKSCVILNSRRVRHCAEEKHNVQKTLRYVTKLYASAPERCPDESSRLDLEHSWMCEDQHHSLCNRQSHINLLKVTADMCIMNAIIQGW